MIYFYMGFVWILMLGALGICIYSGIENYLERKGNDSRKS